MNSNSSSLTVSVRDPEKFQFLLELLRGLPYVEVEVNEPRETIPLTPAERAQRFLETAGAWEGRDVDAAELRKQAWTRANSGS